MWLCNASRPLGVPLIMVQFEKLKFGNTRESKSIWTRANIILIRPGQEGRLYFEHCMQWSNWSDPKTKLNIPSLGKINSQGYHLDEWLVCALDQVKVDTCVSDTNWFAYFLKWVKTTKFLILRNATCMSTTNQHSSKWYPRLIKWQ